VGKRAAPWQGRFKSLVARLTLIDACMTNLPMHTLGLFLPVDGTHVGFDKHQNRFSGKVKEIRRSITLSNGKSCANLRAKVA
jgi:hypothetical protein